MKTITATILAMAAVTCGASAGEKLNAYADCWSGSANGYLDRPLGDNTPRQFLKDAIENGDFMCGAEMAAAMREGPQATADMREKLEITLTREFASLEAQASALAPRRPEKATSSIVTLPSQDEQVVANEKPAPADISPFWNPQPPLASEVAEERASFAVRYGASASQVYKPKNRNAVFNHEAAWLCRLPSDVEKFRSLLQAGETEAATNIWGCIYASEPVEGIRTNSIGDLIQLSVVTNGRAVDLWADEYRFKTRWQWLRKECEKDAPDPVVCKNLGFDD